MLPELQQGNWTSFFVVTAVLVVSSFGPYWLFGEWKSTAKGAAGGGGGGKSSGGNGSGGGSRKQAAAAA